MIDSLKLFLKTLRKVYLTIHPLPGYNSLPCLDDPDSVSELIQEYLNTNQPLMLARFGSTELSCITNYISIKYYKNHFFDYVSGRISPWWWDLGVVNQMQKWSGFFPPTIKNIEKFCEFMLNDIREVDILGSWLLDERILENDLHKSKKIHFELINPYFSSIPWTRALEGKRVLVVHPFASTIESQYKNRELIFNNNLLPEFHLMTLKAVQSLAGNETIFFDWFEALDYMKSEIDKHEYDFCLIGCGAYGFPLAAHVKRMGKKAIHMGGALQLLFGIRGKRWENQNYNEIFNYSQLMNEHWIKPSEEEKPKVADMVEGACYW